MGIFRNNEKKALKKQIEIKHQKQCISNPLKRKIADYAEYYNSETVKDYMILYEAFWGQSIDHYGNNLFKEFIERNDFEQYEHVWVIKDFELDKLIRKQYETYKNVKIVEYLSNEYFYYLACAKILINNAVFPYFFTKKEEQVYINTLHGMMFESAEEKLTYGNMEFANMIRNFLLTDYLISSCDIQTKWYRETCQLDGIYQGKIIEVRQTGEKVWDVILNNEIGTGVIHGLVTKKKKILAYLGMLKLNGITESFNSLLSMLDYDKFDMTVIVMAKSDPDALEKFCSKNPKVRVYIRVGQYNATLEEAVNNEMVMKCGLDDPDIKNFYSDTFYRKEYRRSFGDIKFNYIVNFTGYSDFFSVLLLQAKEAKKFIWLHSDMMKDKNRIVNGEKINEETLNTVFSTYPYYDRLVSCSKSVMHVNRDSILIKNTNEKHTYCRNMVNFERVFEGAKQGETVVIEDRLYHVKAKENKVDDIVVLDVVPVPKRENMNFVTMGRLSPEKNHGNMIRAFAKFNREYPNSSLYILGDGSLMEDMQRLIREECCVGQVKLLGNVSNPFAFMKYCDCFLLPSYYEGQPMVLLEARAMGLPIIVAEFSTVSDSLIKNGQLLIKQDIESIYKSFVAYANDKVPHIKFDCNKYNESSYYEFERLFEDKEEVG